MSNETVQFRGTIPKNIDDHIRARLRGMSTGQYITAIMLGAIAGGYDDPLKVLEQDNSTPESNGPSHNNS